MVKQNSDAQNTTDGAPAAGHDVPGALDMQSAFNIVHEEMIGWLEVMSAQKHLSMQHVNVLSSKLINLRQPLPGLRDTLANAMQLIGITDAEIVGLVFEYIEHRMVGNIKASVQVATKLISSKSSPFSSQPSSQSLGGMLPAPTVYSGTVSDSMYNRTKAHIQCSGLMITL